MSLLQGIFLPHSTNHMFSLQLYMDMPCRRCSILSMGFVLVLHLPDTLWQHCSFLNWFVISLLPLCLIIPHILYIVDYKDIMIECIANPCCNTNLGTPCHCIEICVAKMSVYLGTNLEYLQLWGFALWSNHNFLWFKILLFQLFQSIPDTYNKRERRDLNNLLKSLCTKLKEKLNITDLLKRDIPQPPIKASPDSIEGSTEQNIASPSLSSNLSEEDKKGGIFSLLETDEGWRATFLLKQQVFYHESSCM